MQVLYMLQTSEGSERMKAPEKILQEEVGRTTDLFVYLLYCIIETTRYAETDARLRAGKNLLTRDDLNVNIKIAGNEIAWKIIENPSYKKALESLRFKGDDTKEQVKRLYYELVSSDQYKEYISVKGRDFNSEKEILLFIFNTLMLPGEIFTAYAEECFSNWDDDIEMIQLLMQHYLQKPGTYNLQQLAGTEKWKFAKDLLATVIDKKDYAQDLIKPKLKNWDADRIALLDMILMQMGVCEFLYFETIPTKVTINEYIDLAKDYSTPQSGQFVNGILDNIHKELSAQNKIHKTDFRQKA